MSSAAVPEYGRGPRARLRGWRADDLVSYRGWLRPEHEWHRWDGPYYPVPDDAAADAAVERLERAAAAQASHPRGLAEDGLPPGRVVVADEDDRLVGTCSWYWESVETRWARVGLGLYDPSAMLGVGRALGFVEEGRFRDARVVDGVRYDSVVMGVLRGEWRSTA